MSRVLGGVALFLFEKIAKSIRWNKHKTWRSGHFRRGGKFYRRWRCWHYAFYGHKKNMSRTLCNFVNVRAVRGGWDVLTMIWKKSCTTWDVNNPVNSGINYLLTGAGFQPSTV